jgi:hypothetical protein
MISELNPRDSALCANGPHRLIARMRLESQTSGVEGLALHRATFDAQGSYHLTHTITARLERRRWVDTPTHPTRNLDGSRVFGVPLGSRLVHLCSSKNPTLATWFTHLGPKRAWDNLGVISRSSSVTRKDRLSGTGMKLGNRFYGQLANILLLRCRVLQAAALLSCDTQRVPAEVWDRAIAIFRCRKLCLELWINLQPT